MKLAVTYRAIWVGFLLVAASDVGLAQSKYEAPFENYRRTLDVQAFGEGIRNAGSQTTHLDEDVKYLASVLTSGSFDATAQGTGRQQLDAIAYSVVAYSGSVSIQNALVPAMEAFQTETGFAHSPRSIGRVSPKRAAVALTLAVLALLAEPLPSYVQEPLARRILQETDADQTKFMTAYLDSGAPAEMGDALTMLVLNRSALALPPMERKVEQVLASPSPSDCFSDKSVDPQVFVNMIVSMIAYAGDDQAMQMVRRLIKIDENRFGGLVGSTLTSSSAWRNPFGVAYRAFDIGDPAMDKRIAAWAESELISKAGTTAEQMKRSWAEAMVDKYRAAPTERQWAEDPFAARLSAPLAVSIHNEMLRLAVEVLEKRPRK